VNRTTTYNILNKIEKALNFAFVKGKFKSKKSEKSIDKWNRTCYNWKNY
jgi:hypothetical protein